MESLGHLVFIQYNQMRMNAVLLYKLTLSQTSKFLDSF